MGPASKFDEFPANFEDEFIGDGGGSTSSPVSEEGSEDEEEQLIKDGNDQVLKSFETRKKNQEYSRSQARREKKAPELSMDFVDWSGFPGAAHTSPGIVATRKSRSERRLGGSTSNSASTPTNDSEQRPHTSRSHQRKLAAAKGIVAKTGEEGQEVSHPPKKEPPKYRNRRHSLKGSGSTGLSTSLHEGGAAASARAARRSSLNLNLSRSNHRPTERRPQRRGSGSATAKRSQRATTTLESTSPSGRIRRPVNAAAASTMLERSQRATTPLKSTSPSGRIRRPVNAAAASTMLEGGRKPPQRAGSNGRRQRSHRLGATNGALKAPDAGVLASKTSAIKW
jgi:hypothetical protein